uniref:Uncharacterized protein n=1 Tax=Moniliophthora roreri TaxID=221103 RepID=A0A0W0F8A5_MONRR
MCSLSQLFFTAQGLAHNLDGPEPSEAGPKPWYLGWA